MRTRIIALILLSAFLLAAIAAGPVRAAPDAVIGGPDGEYAAHRLIVTFSPPAASHADLFRRVHANAGAVVSRDLGRFGLPGRHVVTLPAEADLDEAAARYCADPAVLRVEKDWVVRLDRTPDDPRYGELWGLPKVAAPAAWDRTTGSTEVVVGVIDTGVDVTHPDLAANIWTNPGEMPGNGLDDDRNGYVDDVHGWDFRNGDAEPDDAYGHGTHCAGTIAAAGDNGIGVAGMAWRARIMSLKYMQGDDYGFVSVAAEAILYANRMGADVLSCSWYEPDSTLIRDAIAASPALVVCSAGNNARDTDMTPQYPACYPLDQIVSVAATDPTDGLASFSNYGQVSVDLGAPGLSILSCLPGGRYGLSSGTSMAVPHVAGAAALALSLNRSLSTPDLKRALLEGTDSVPALAGRTVSSGRLNALGTLVRVAPALAAIPGASAPPTDPDGDGLYEDTNGNGRADFADIVLFFNQLSWVAANEPLAAFDYNDNGRLDFADVVRLFDRL